MNFKRFINDIEYNALVPLFVQKYTEMSVKQAKENFDWFISKIPERIVYLRNRCALDLQISTSLLDISAESLIPIWEWFIYIARIEKTPNDEVETMKKTYAHLGDSFINYEKFTVNTEFIIRDIGMYLGQVFITHHSIINWSFYTKPKNHFVNRPILVGFEDKKYNPPYKTVFDPIGMTRGEAISLFDNTAHKKGLYDLYAKWAEYTPK